MADEKQSNQVQGRGIAGDTAMRDRARLAPASVQASASEVVRQAAEAGRGGTEALHLTHATATEVARCAAAAGLESGRHLFETSTKQIEEFSHQMTKTIQAVTEEMRGLVQLPAVNGGLRDLQQAIAGLIAGVTQTNLRVTQEMFRLNGPGAALDLQRRVAGEYFDTFVEGQTAILRAAQRTVEDTLRPLERWTMARQHAEVQERSPGVGARAR
jgi:hypothetical protein